MRGTTHLLFGLLLATVLIEHVGFERPLLAALLVLLGSVLPDIDERSSLVGRRVPVVSFFVRHRTFFHSVVFLTACVIALSFLVPQPYVWAFAAAFSLHLLLDALTPMGVRPFWPSRLRLRGFVPVGSALERLVVLVAAAAFVWLLLR